MKGAVKEVAGKAAGDAKLDSDGKADKIQAMFKTPRRPQRHAQGEIGSTPACFIPCDPCDRKRRPVQPDADSFDEVVVNRLSSVQYSEPDTIARI
jgi:hypothetical protein